MTRRLIVNWQDPDSRRVLPVAELLVADGPRPRFELGYLRAVTEAERFGFRPFADFPDLGRRYASPHLFALFQNRIMPKSRPDYAGYLASLGLAPETVSVPELLGRSGGRRQTDHVETALVPERDPETARLVTHFLVRGVRHCPDGEHAASTLAEGDLLELRPQLDNEHDLHAQRLMVGDRLLGYVPAYLSEEVVALDALGAAPSVTVARMSPPPALVQHRVLARLECDWPEGYVPFSGERFEPIAGRQLSAA